MTIVVDGIYRLKPRGLIQRLFPGTILDSRDLFLCTSLISKYKDTDGMFKLYAAGSCLSGIFLIGKEMKFNEAEVELVYYSIYKSKVVPT